MTYAGCIPFLILKQSLICHIIYIFAMALTEYKKKRKFSNTPEPEGKSTKKRMTVMNCCL